MEKSKGGYRSSCYYSSARASNIAQPFKRPKSSSLNHLIPRRSNYAIFIVARLPDLLKHFNKKTLFVVRISKLSSKSAISSLCKLLSLVKLFSAKKKEKRYFLRNSGTEEMFRSPNCGKTYGRNGRA